jgi:serine-aspartate repeat-containing protein C/D/E
MSLFMRKNAIVNVSSSRARRKQRKRSKDAANAMNRVCRIEPLEKREYLAADPISVGFVYAEQYQEDLGDRFYIAWVGGEEDVTTLDSITINLDKNGNGVLDDGEAFFDTEPGGRGVYSAVPFTLVDKTSDIGYSYQVEDGGMVLTISFTNFHAGDHFIFDIDLDEYQTNTEKDADNALVEGGEMGGSVVRGLSGSIATAVFSSPHYQTETWTGMFVDDYDGEYTRDAALSDAYDRSLLPYDLDDGNEGISQAGIYGDLDLTPKPIVISGYVYGDRNVDCNYDLGNDDPLANVGMTLVDEHGNTWTTVTDVNGYYEFSGDDLLPGKYRIFSETNLVSPEGYQYFDFCAKGGEYGQKVTPLEIEVSGMLGGELAPQNNFAKVLKGSIEGHVFEDRNDANGKEAGESWDGDAYPARIELWRIDYDSNGVKNYTLMETQTVDADGRYKFSLDGSWNEAGTLRKLPEKTYEIREIFDSPDYSDGKDYVGSLGGDTLNDVFTDIYVGYGENGYNYDFGELKLGSIAGNVWEDRNDNGIVDAGEDGIADVIVELYQWDGASYVKIGETRTDEDGSYLFDNLDIEKEYAVKEIQPSDYDDGKDAVGSLGGELSNDYVSKINIGWDEHGYDYNFGELKLGSIEGNVYEDRNDNGVFDSNETGIGNVEVELYQWNGSEYVKIAETRTAEDGSYKFDKLDINQEYAVREKQPVNYDDGQDAVGSLGGDLSNDYISAIPIQWDEHGVEYNFGELKLGSIAGNVYEDRNDNGVFDADETGIGSVKVELYQLVDGSYVKIAETMTAEDGSYKFDKLDINQKYAVKEIQPSDYDDGRDAVGSLGGDLSNDYVNEIDIQWDDHGVEYNFGELKLGSVSGYVYHDVNDNGLMEKGEDPIANVTVELYQLVDGSYVKIAETTTDENGFYKFDSLDIEQTYAVKEIQPENWRDGKDTVGTLGGEIAANDHINDVLVKWDQHGEEYNFGELAPLGSLSGYVYEDNNNNGIMEDGEAGIANVVVKLYIVGDDGKATLVGIQETDEKGYYKFDSLDTNETYIIRETQPDEYYDGKEAIGTIFGEEVGDLSVNDEISGIMLPNGGEGIQYNFGELKPASISGYVYEDYNNNGIKESGENGIPSTVVTLQVLNEETGLYEDMNRIALTDAGGHYIFDNLEPARIYRVVETQPNGYRDGKDTIGSLGGKVANDVLYSISVAPGDKGVDYNFGELPKREIPEAGGYTPSVSIPNNLWGASPTSFPYIWYQPTIPGSMTTLYGGGGGFTEDYVWKLSVLNGGSPRFDFDLADQAAYAYGGFINGNLIDDGGLRTAFVNVAAERETGYVGVWTFADGTTKKMKLSGLDNRPVSGDWDGDGKDDIGVFTDGSWRLAVGDWFDTLGYLSESYSLHVTLGSTGDQPVTGDWDGDGKTDIAIFGLQNSTETAVIDTDPGLPSDLNTTVTDSSANLRSTARFANVSAVKRAKNLPPSETLFANTESNARTAARSGAHRTRKDLVDHIFRYGSSGDVAIAGDWNGDGRAEIGFYKDGVWVLDMNGNGRIDEGDVTIRGRGGANSIPVVGDWNGDGVDNIGVFEDGEWLLDTTGDYNFNEVRNLGSKGDFPVVGDWDGDGIDEIAVYHEEIERTPQSDGTSRVVNDNQTQPVDDSNADLTMRE